MKKPPFHMHLPWFKVVLAFVMGFLSAQGFSQTVVAQVLIRDTVDVQTPDPSLILSEYVPIPENGFYSIIYNQTFRNPPGNYLRDDNIYTWEGKSITLSASNKTITHDLGAVLPIVFKQRNETNLGYQGGESYPVWAYTSEASGSEYLGYLSAGSVFISLQGSDAELFASYGPDDGLATGFWQMKYRSPINYRCPSQNFIPSGGGRFEDWLEFGFEKVTPEFEVIPEDSIVYVSDKTTLHVTTTLSGFSGNLDLRVSDATLGYLALMDVAGDGTEFIVKQGSGLSDIPYAVLEKENSTTNEYVVFIATEESMAKVQIFASLSDDPNSAVVGFGEVVVGEPIIEILNADMIVVAYLDIANWENAYGEVPYFPRNDEDDGDDSNGKENFVDTDSSRFFVRITDFSKNSDSTRKDVISQGVSIETIGVNYPNDDQTTIQLTENAKNSGVFISEALILTAPDLEIPSELPPVIEANEFLWVSDDDFRAQNNITGFGSDDETNDRTHKTEIGGTVKVEYKFSPSKTLSSQASVCEEVKKVKYRFVTFLEPLRKAGVEYYFNLSRHYEEIDYTKRPDFERLRPVIEGDQTKYESDLRGGIATQEIADFYIEQTRRAYGQACIDFEPQGPLDVIDAPLDANGNDIFRDQLYNEDNWDGNGEAPPAHLDDMHLVFQAYKSVMKPDVVYIFLGPPFISEDLGIAFTIIEEYPEEYEGFPSYISSRYTDGIYSHIHLSPSALPTTLAHEFGHILTRSAIHKGFEPYIIFPAQLSIGYDLLANYQVNSQRRFKKSFITSARQSPLAKSQ